MIDREKTILELKEFFCIEELVDRDTFNRDGDKCWRYFTTDLLYTLLQLRININRPITINNWKFGGRFSQRGLRTNISSIVQKKTLKNMLYLSPHIFGKAVDFDVKGMTAQQVRKWIVDHQDLFLYKIRLENKKSGKPINWVHLDTFTFEGSSKIYLFNV